MAESMGDESQAVYIKDGDAWFLVLVVNPDATDAYSWPDRTTPATISRWRRNCRFKRVKWRKQAGIVL
jgi:hypothetical protein